MFVFHPNKKILFDWCSGEFFWVTEKVESLNIGQSNCPLQNTSDSPFKAQTQHFKLFSKHKHFPSNHHFLLQDTWLSNLAQQTLFTQARQRWFALVVKAFVFIVLISADFSYVSLYPLFSSYHQRWHALAVEVFVIIVLISADFSFFVSLLSSRRIISTDLFLLSACRATIFWPHSGTGGSWTKGKKTFHGRRWWKSSPLYVWSLVSVDDNYKT